MKITFEKNDVAIFTSDDGTECGGTIIDEEETGLIIQTGPGNNNVEAIQKSSIRHVRLLRTSIPFSFGHYNLPDTEGDGEPYIQPPPRSIYPTWDGIRRKWYHLPDDLCVCGCKKGGDSTSPDYITDE